MNNGKKKAGWILFGVLVVVILLILMFPVAAMISVSLKKANDVFTMPVTWVPKVFAFENYVEVFRKMHIVNGFKASVIITSMTIILIMVIAIPAAYAFSNLNFYFKKQLYYLVLVSQMFAPVIVIIPLYSMMNKMGLIDNWLSLVLMNTTFNLAFIVLMLKATFDSVPKEVVEAAKIDGASDTRVMFSIVIPLLKPIIVFTIVQSSIGMFNLFTEPFILTNSSWTGGVNNGGLTLMMYLLNKAPQGGNSYGYASACAYVITIMIVIISVFVNKFSEEKDEGRRKYGK